MSEANLLESLITFLPTFLEEIDPKRLPDKKLVYFSTVWPKEFIRLDDFGGVP